MKKLLQPLWPLSLLSTFLWLASPYHKSTHKTQPQQTPLRTLHNNQHSQQLLHALLQWQNPSNSQLEFVASCQKIYANPPQNTQHTPQPPLLPTRFQLQNITFQYNPHSPKSPISQLQGNAKQGLLLHKSKKSYLQLTSHIQIQGKFNQSKFLFHTTHLNLLKLPPHHLSLHIPTPFTLYSPSPLGYLQANSLKASFPQQQPLQGIWKLFPPLQIILNPQLLKPSQHTKPHILRITSQSPLLLQPNPQHPNSSLQIQFPQPLLLDLFPNLTPIPQQPNQLPPNPPIQIQCPNLSILLKKLPHSYQPLYAQANGNIQLTLKSHSHTLQIQSQKLYTTTNLWQLQGKPIQLTLYPHSNPKQKNILYAQSLQFNPQTLSLNLQQNIHGLLYLSHLYQPKLPHYLPKLWKIQNVHKLQLQLNPQYQPHQIYAQAKSNPILLTSIHQNWKIQTHSLLAKKNYLQLLPKPQQTLKLYILENHLQTQSLSLNPSKLQLSGKIQANLQGPFSQYLLQLYLNLTPNPTQPYPLPMKISCQNAQIQLSTNQKLPPAILLKNNLHLLTPQYQLYAQQASLEPNAKFLLFQGTPQQPVKISTPNATLQTQYLRYFGYSQRILANQNFHLLLFPLPHNPNPSAQTNSPFPIYSPWHIHANTATLQLTSTPNPKPQLLRLHSPDQLTIHNPTNQLQAIGQTLIWNFSQQRATLHAYPGRAKIYLTEIHGSHSASAQLFQLSWKTGQIHASGGVHGQSNLWPQTKKFQLPSSWSWSANQAKLLFNTTNKKPLHLYLQQYVHLKNHSPHNTTEFFADQAHWNFLQQKISLQSKKFVYFRQNQLRIKDKKMTYLLPKRILISRGGMPWQNLPPPIKQKK